MGKLKKIRSYMTEFEALQARHTLEANGISAFVEGANMNTTLSYIGPAIGGVRLLVDDQDQQRALGILEDERHSSAGGPWCCANCFSQIDEGFDVCWKCGADRDDAEYHDDHPSAHDDHQDYSSAPEHQPPAPIGNQTNPFVAPRSEQPTNPLHTNQEGVSIVQRAFRAAVLGCVILPVVAHIYSLVLIVRAIAHSPLPTGAVVRLFIAMGIDLAAILFCIAWLAAYL